MLFYDLSFSRLPKSADFFMFLDYVAYVAFFFSVITLEFHPQECGLGCMHECIYVRV